MSEELGKRAILARIMREKGINTKAELAEWIGVTPAVVSNWFKRNSFPIDKVMAAFPDICPQFIVTGQGQFHATKDTINVFDDDDTDEAKNDIIGRMLSIIERQQAQIEVLLKLLQQ